MIKVRTNLFRAAALCVSSEATRYYLTGVYVEPHHERGVLLVGTDGHRMLVAHDDDGTCTKPAIIKPTLVDLAARLWFGPGGKPVQGDDEDDDDWGVGPMEDKTEAPPVLLIDDGGKLEVGAIRSTEPVAIDGKFPDWRKAVAGVPNDVGEPATFQGRYVGSFATISGLLGHSGAVRIIGSAAGPSLVLFPGCACAFGVLMPMKDHEASIGLPAFMNEPAKAA